MGRDAQIDSEIHTQRKCVIERDISDTARQIVQLVQAMERLRRGEE